MRMLVAVVVGAARIYEIAICDSVEIVEYEDGRGQRMKSGRVWYVSKVTTSHSEF